MQLAVKVGGGTLKVLTVAVKHACGHGIGLNMMAGIVMMVVA